VSNTNNTNNSNKSNFTEGGDVQKQIEELQRASESTNKDLRSLQEAHTRTHAHTHTHS
jgi:cell fate (sporulation/competence/biofilm development) regulator YlbF (YheA/YmcA/DUF963 family)